MDLAREKKLLGVLGVLLCVYAALRMKQIPRLKTRPRPINRAKPKARRSEGGLKHSQKITAMDEQQLRIKRIRRFKTRPINRARRSEGGCKYYQKIKTMDKQQFFKYTRMTVSTFDKLVNLVSPRIRKGMRSDGISPEERVLITLQYLSQGCSMQALALNFHVGLTTVHKIIRETCEALWKTLGPIYLKNPSSEVDWCTISNGFYSKWDFPNCLGALDGKHINIKAPAKSGSLFFNHKKNFSVVLLAACDSSYKFTFVDIGAYGSQSDGGIFKHSIFGQQLENEDMNIPTVTNLPNSNTELPFFFVADEVFPLKKFIMRPYPGKDLSKKQHIFNYRLSRARHVIENTFGILSARWRILKTIINANVETVDSIIKAVVVLHNYCQSEVAQDYCPPNYVDNGEDQTGGWRDEEAPLQSVGRMSANISKRELYEIRDRLAEYFVSKEGQVPWQEQVVNGGLL